MSESTWETQQPLEIASLKKELELYKTIYQDILNKHAAMIAAWYEHDDQRLLDLTNASIYGNYYSREEVLKAIRLNLTKGIPPFFKL